MDVTLSKWTLWRCFWRSLFLQAGFSTEGMQSLGLVYALAPALTRLYPDEAKRREAFTRHLTPFNTHPYAAAAIVGGILAIEQRVVRGLDSAESVGRFKTALMGPLAALGDGFFWLSLRPAVGAVSVALLPKFGAWAVLFYVVAYNLVHVVSRMRLFWLGVSLGEGLIEALKAWRVPVWSDRLRVLAAGAAGGMSAWLAATFGVQARGWAQPVLDGVSLGAVVLMVFLLSKKVSGYVLLYASAAVVMLLTALEVF